MCICASTYEQAHTHNLFSGIEKVQTYINALNKGLLFKLIKYFVIKKGLCYFIKFVLLVISYLNKYVKRMLFIPSKYSVISTQNVYTN